MNRVQKNFAFLAIGGIINVLIAYVFGSQGIEAFYAVYLVSEVLLIQQLLWYARKVTNSSGFLVLRMLGLLFIFTVGLLITVVSLAPLIFDSISASVELPTINWWVVVAGLVTQIWSLRHDNKEPEWQELVLKSLNSMMTIVIMLVAFIIYLMSPTLSKSIILVISVEMLFIMNYVVLKTKYMQRIQQIMLESIQKTLFKGSQVEVYAQVLPMSIPFLLPLIVLLLMVIV